MGSFSIIKRNKSSNNRSCLIYILKMSVTVDSFLFYYTIHPFCNGIVGRLGVLGHTDGDVVLVECINIQITTVLHSPVRMMNQPGQILLACLVDSIGQGIQCNGSLECVSQLPTYDLVRIGIGDQVQVTASNIQTYIRYITHPQLICCGRYKSFYEIFVLVIPMIGVGRMSGLRSVKHQLVATQQLEKVVTTRNTLPAEDATDHYEEFEATDAGIFLADLFYRIN